MAGSHAGRRREPGHLAGTAEKVAEVRGTAVDVVGDTEIANALRLFRLPQGRRGEDGVLDRRGPDPARRRGPGRRSEDGSGVSLAGEELQGVAHGRCTGAPLEDQGFGDAVAGLEDAIGEEDALQDPATRLAPPPAQPPPLRSWAWCWVEPGLLEVELGAGVDWSEVTRLKAMSCSLGPGLMASRDPATRSPNESANRRVTELEKTDRPGKPGRAG